MAEEVTHAEIYARLIEVESKVDCINQRTQDVVDAFNAARGAFTVLEFIAKIAKPLLWIGGLVAAIGAMWSNYKP
jgi:predicted CoA-binding protein